MIITEEHLQDNCGYSAFLRGEKYFQQGRVVAFSSQGNQESIEVKGQVSGSLNYQQNISVKHRLDVNKFLNADDIRIVGHCSCPVGYNCKHVVAVLLNYLSVTSKDNILKNNKPQKNITTTKKQQVEQLNAWFDDFNNILQPNTANSTNRQNKFLAYILTETTTAGELEVSFLISGIKKKGGFYKPKSTNLDNLLNAIGYYEAPDHIKTLDKVIITLLNTQRDRYFYHYKPLLLQGEVGQQVLEKMLLSQHCFWQELKEDRLLLTGENKDLSYQWQPVSHAKNSAMKLGLNLEPDIQIISVEPPYYIDTETMQVGQLKTTLSPIQIQHFNEMPAVPAKLLEEVSLKLISQNLDTSIPLPAKVELNYLNGQDLKPKIKLSHLSLENMKLSHGLKVSFLYADFEIQILDDEKVVKKHLNQLYKINRDITQENIYIEQLIELGFELVRYGVDDNKINTNNHNDQVALVAASHLTHQQQLLLWQDFTENQCEILTSDGWVIEQSDDFYLSFIQADDDWDVAVEDENDWFSLKFDLTLPNGQKLPLIPIVSPLLKDYSLDNIPEILMIETQTGQYIQLKRIKIMPIVKLLYELFDTLPTSQESIKISTFDALQVDQLLSDEHIQVNWLGSKKLQKLGKKLASFNGLKTVLPSKKFTGELREYQQQGLNWLQFLRDFEFGGLLADDMGLGKTVQTLVHLQKEKMAKRMQQPCLVVAPTSLMSNWKKEANLFTPNLKVLILQGTDRHEKFEDINNSDIILTTYPLIVRDYEFLSQHQFHIIVLDEAQNIKNPKSKATQLIKSFSTKHRLALTGTPMENHLGELWSIFDFLMPGFLGSESGFRKKYRTPIEKHGNAELSKMLSQRIKPFLLRRTKEKVAKELPPKTTIIKSAVMGEQQSSLYETVRIAMEKKIEQALASKGLNRSHITILDALLKLRQVCCDPQLLKLPQAKKVKESAKLNLLMTMLPELLEEGRRVLLFSQFTSMLTLIEKELKLKNIQFSKLTGSTKNREQAIETFTSGKVPLFLISLKAGGVGLNLTEADTVIHYDPWWNPAVENQASDRAHRIGQDKPVFVYKLIVENTLEEKILEMQAKKQALADGVYGESKGKSQSALTKEDIVELLAN